MNSYIKFLAAWFVPRMDIRGQVNLYIASHWQFLFHRERWSRRATVVGEDLEQVTSNCLPGSGEVSSGWMEGIEGHAGYRYLRIGIVTSLRATGSLPPKRGHSRDMNQFRLALINPLRSFLLHHFLSNFPTRVSLNEILTFRGGIIPRFSDQFYSSFGDASVPESRRVVPWENWVDKDVGRDRWRVMSYLNRFYTRVCNFYMYIYIYRKREMLVYSMEI